LENEQKKNLSSENKKQTSSDTFNQLYRRIYSFLLSGNMQQKPDFPTFEDGHYGMLVSEAIEQSAREKVWKKVRIEELN
jgi:predicted dehydrogenase